MSRVSRAAVPFGEDIPDAQDPAVGRESLPVLDEVLDGALLEKLLVCTGTQPGRHHSPCATAANHLQPKKPKMKEKPNKPTPSHSRPTLAVTQGRHHLATYRARMWTRG